MFYARINKIKVFNNREGFLGLFNRAELRIYSYATPVGADLRVSPPTLSDLMALPDDASRKQRLLDAVLSEADSFAQSYSIDIDGVRDNQTLLFGETGLLLYRSDAIPDALRLQLWVIESDEDVRRWALDADKIMDSDAFKGLVAAATAALAVTNPILTASIGVGGVLVNLLRGKLREKKDDLVGYWLCDLNRAEHYPHGTRDRQDVSDTTGNIQVDYTLFGYDKEME
ncbi:MAG: hypothetical protein LBR08_03405 [Bacteroidales bacterium]|jgi:hypothetical protein|nr:hypothetical protein [Bacteroidales bacterium]